MTGMLICGKTTLFLYSSKFLLAWIIMSTSFMEVSYRKVLNRMYATFLKFSSVAMKAASLRILWKFLLGSISMDRELKIRISLLAYSRTTSFLWVVPLSNPFRLSKYKLAISLKFYERM